MPKKHYPEAVEQLISIHQLPELGPGVPNRDVAQHLNVLKIEKLFPNVVDSQMARACLSGLWLLHDFLDESHSISQEIDTPTGSFWHAIMHRREPDAFNSKYWWRRVGNHPVLKQMKDESITVGYAYTTPEEFVDFCERVRGSGTGEEVVARRVQFLEWQLLFNWCWQEANPR